MADNRYDEAVDIVARSFVAFDGHISATLPNLTGATYDAIYSRIRLIENRPTRGAFEAAVDYLTNNPKEKHDD